MACKGWAKKQERPKTNPKNTVFTLCKKIYSYVWGKAICPSVHIVTQSSGNTSVQILNSMAPRVPLLYPPYNSLIRCFSIKLLAFWILFQFSGILVTQSITICLQVKVFSHLFLEAPFSAQHSNAKAHHKEHETFSSPPPSPQLILTNVNFARIALWFISLYVGEKNTHINDT